MNRPPGKQASLPVERHTLAPVFSRTKILALLFKGPREAAGTLEFLATSHGVIPLLDCAMVLLQPLLQIVAGPVLHFPPEEFTDGFWIGRVCIRGHFFGV